MESRPEPGSFCDVWEQFADPRFEVRFRYPPTTPSGEPVERQERQEHDVLRVHILSGDRAVYFEVRRYPPLRGEAEYAQHTPHLRARFADLVLTELTDTSVGAWPAQTYTFAWSEGERTVLLLGTDTATYRVIYDPRAPLNQQILATLSVQ